MGEEEEEAGWAMSMARTFESGRRCSARALMLWMPLRQDAVGSQRARTGFPAPAAQVQEEDVGRRADRQHAPYGAGLSGPSAGLRSLRPSGPRVGSRRLPRSYWGGEWPAWPKSGVNSGSTLLTQPGASCSAANVPVHCSGGGGTAPCRLKGSASMPQQTCVGGPFAERCRAALGAAGGRGEEKGENGVIAFPTER